MALATLILVIGAVVGAVWLLARRAAWADVHPPLASIEVFGDWIALPLEAKWTGRLNSLPGGGKASERIAVQSDTHTQSGPSQVTARGAK
jgi:hypothetical protein